MAHREEKKMERAEMIEKIVEKTGVSYEEAKETLERCGYDLLDAILILEREGKVQEKKTAYYTSGTDGAAESTADNRTERLESNTMNDSDDSSYRREWERRKAEKEQSKEETRQQMQRAWDSFKNLVITLIRHGLKISFTVERKGEELISLPVLVVVILAVVSFGSMFAVAILGLFFGCHYHFTKNGRNWPEE